MMIILCAAALLLAVSSASVINFSSSPDTVIPGTTNQLTIRCSVNDAVMSSPIIIGKRDVMARQVQHVTSIVISRTNIKSGLNETVASVTTFDQPTAHVDLGKLTVDGSTVPDGQGETGYLQLDWSNPTADQYGTYYCEAFGLDTESHPENYEARLDIGVSSSSSGSDTLLQLILDLQNRVDLLEQQNGQSSGGQSSLQMGNVRCAQGTHDYPILFSPPLTYVPQVFSAVAGATSSDGYVFLPSALNIDQNGFTLRCTANRDTDILWLAV